LLDTNILLAYVRLNRIYAAVESQYTLLTTTPAPLISIVSEGELRALAAEFNWGTTKRLVMEELLARFTIVPLPFADVLDRYVQVSEHCRRGGRVVGKNDLWIAATAMATGATLLTTDKDFDPLHPTLLARDWIDPAI
jgi:tRNA(fMet)-specific endonuclease VapC